MINALIDTQTLLSSVQAIFIQTTQRVFNRHTLAICAACVVFAALSGPFGTYDRYSFGQALLVWSVLVTCSVLVAFFVNEVCLALLGQFPPVWTDVAFAICGSIAITSVVVVLLTFWIERTSELRPSVFMLWLYVLSIICVIMSVRNVVQNFTVPVAEVEKMELKTEHSQLTQPLSRLAKRLNVPQDTKIIHISADGHFVEVNTQTAAHRIRMRFSDAVAELDDTIGLMVHRSHWVHRDALQSWAPNAPKPYLVLETGAQVPVSKTYFGKVEATGLTKIESSA